MSWTKLGALSKRTAFVQRFSGVDEHPAREYANDEQAEYVGMGIACSIKYKDIRTGYAVYPNASSHWFFTMVHRTYCWATTGTTTFCHD